MSYPDNEQNPWKSLADLLINKMDVVTLASAIEEKGIYTWDRFGRMRDATKGDANDLYSKARALDLLALVYKSDIEAHNDIERHDLDEFIEDYDGPLVGFGWPLDECPDFEKYKPEHSMPATVKRAGQPHEDNLLGTRERKSLYAIIRALITIAKIPTDPIIPWKIAESLAPETSPENEKRVLHTNTIANHLKRIYGLT
jgi:hypothetical protein